MNPTRQQIIESAWNALVNAPNAQPEQVPEGWLSAFQVADKLKQSVTNARLKVRAAVANGTFEQKKFRILCGNDVRRVWHYRPKA